MNQEKPIFTYLSKEAIEDGYLMENPRTDNFKQCNIITTNLFEKLQKVEFERNLKRVFPYNPLELLGCLMVAGSEKFNNKDFKSDDDENFFTLEPTQEGLKVWFVKNEYGLLTAMLPEDY